MAEQQTLNDRAAIVTGPEFGACYGLAWAGDDEVWYTAGPGTEERGLRGLALTGQERRILDAPGDLVLHDVKDGQALVSRTTRRRGIRSHHAGESGERERTWLDGSALVSAEELREARARLAPLRLASVRVDEYRSAPARFCPAKSQPVRLLPPRSIPDKSWAR